MDNIMNILTTAGGLLTKLLDFLSELLAKAPLRNLLSLVLLCVVLLAVYMVFHVAGYQLMRPFLSRITKQMATLELETSEEPGTPKPYILAVNLNMKEQFRMALADMGLFGHVDTDLLCAEIIRKARHFSEDATWCEERDLVPRTAALKDQANMYLNMLRGIENNRAGRLTGKKDFYADNSILEEFSLGGGDIPAETGMNLYMAGMLESKAYRRFRNLIRAFSIPGRTVNFRFTSASKRDVYASRLKSALHGAAGYVVFRQILRLLVTLQLRQLSYLLKSGAEADERPPDGLKEKSLNVRYQVEDKNGNYYMRYEISSRDARVLRRIREVGTLEIAYFAAEEAALDGIILDGIRAVGKPEYTAQNAISEAFRFDNGIDRDVLAQYINNVVISQVDGLGEETAV